MVRRRLRHIPRGLFGRGRDGTRSAWHWALSFVMLAGFLALGWSSLPANLAAASNAMRLQDPAHAGAGYVTPVFVLQANGAAVRFGDAQAGADGIVRVGLYDPFDPLLTQATVAVSLPADGRLLWLLAEPGERQTLRAKASELVVGLSATVRDIARSPAFQADYREPLLQILRNAVQQAWVASRDSGAWQELLRSYGPILRTVSSRDVRPIVERNFQGIALRMLKSNAMSLINPFQERTWHTEPIEEALRDSIEEIRQRDIPEQTALRLLDSPQTTEFLRVFVGSAGDRLAHDPALQNLIARMIYDPRFRPALQPAIDGTLDIGRTASRLFLSLHGGTDLNLTAAAALRTTITGRPDRVVVFMSAGQRDALMALESGMVYPLDPAEPAGA